VRDKLSSPRGLLRALERLKVSGGICPICTPAFFVKSPCPGCPPTQNRPFVSLISSALRQQSFSRRFFATKRPERPLSFAEIVERQKAQELKEQERQRAQEEFERAVKQQSPRPSRRTSPFRPERGSKRYIQALYKIQYGTGDHSYPFPENIEPIEGLRKRKPIYFRKGHKFLLERYLKARHRLLVESEKLPKRLDRLARRTAFNIVKERYKEEKQMEADKEVVAKWKEGEETFILPVATSDITKISENKVFLREFSDTSTSIKLAAQLLREDAVVAFPTETVYGLGANALSSTAVQKIYQAKNRPADNPLISHFGSIKQLEAFTEIPPIYLPLIKSYWPGPLTILLPVEPEMGISSLVTAGLNTVAVRIPSNPLARALLLEANIPIAAPSANASTRPSPTLGAHVQADLNGRIPLILSADADRETQCDVGLESTVVDGLSNPPSILRLGGISPEQIRSLGGPWRHTIIYQKPTTNGETDFKPRTPGMKYKHYSPACPVFVFKADAAQPEFPSKYLPPSDSKERKVGMLCTKKWEPRVDPNAQVEFNWLGNDDEDIARNLFKCVREMDQWGAEVILVEGIEEKGIGRSVMERLKKMTGGKIEESKDA
jgi:L-threonylcarbamoyladenylate synthase